MTDAQYLKAIEEAYITLRADGDLPQFARAVDDILAAWRGRP